MADITSSILLGPTAIPALLITPGGGKGHSGVARGANYFFGFLITFVALLLIFVGCGIGTRRRIVARRNTAFYETVDPWGNIIHVNPGTQHKPAMYEPLILEGGEKWDDMEASPASSGLVLTPRLITFDSL
ncbi:hypothetical protein BDQ12DRAFT_692628 [Crucibulum laeve]|uniref:Uncharacterized protein n=1 Tax=Crucibulum laeve TaxID=68775 RepID=A0A5C3LGS1_9AGAR|nr:hypothetical protein BDQ12DRAFT_692628 [Crucibulum laeve]